MNHTLTVKNAYGRDFKNKREILEHYNSNKDFQNLSLTSGIVNKQDAKRFKVGYLNVRYNNLMKIAVIDVNKDKFQ
jgi:PKD repeat protein